MPEGLEETWIEFMTGLAAKPGCGGEDLVMVAVPHGHATAGASRAARSNVFGELGERAREWWRSDRKIDERR